MRMTRFDFGCDCRRDFGDKQIRRRLIWRMCWLIPWTPKEAKMETTVNRFTLLDAYLLPPTSEIANNLTTYNVFSTFDLKSAYHQIPIKEEDRKFTGFEANGKLYQFCRIPFGLTNAVACFQRKMNQLISDYSLKDTYAYLDNITIGGRTQEEHDVNVKAFMEMINKLGITLNEDKSVISVNSINLLGYYHMDN